MRGKYFLIFFIREAKKNFENSNSFRPKYNFAQIPLSNYLLVDTILMQTFFCSLVIIESNIF